MNAIRNIQIELSMNSHPQAYYHAAYFDYRLGNRQDEFIHIKALLKKNIESRLSDYAADGINRLSELCTDTNQRMDCVSLLKQLEAAFPTDNKILIATSGCYERFDMLNESAATLQHAKSLQHTDPEIESRLNRLMEKIAGKK